MPAVFYVVLAAIESTFVVVIALAFVARLVLILTLLWLFAKIASECLGFFSL